VSRIFSSIAKYKTVFPKANHVNAELIYPATEKLIAKYSEQQVFNNSHHLDSLRGGNT
jgi:hypothetical protein